MRGLSAICAARLIMEVEPAGVPDRQLVEFAARFIERHGADLAELADL